jgi:hypothetical protein
VITDRLDEAARRFRRDFDKMIARIFDRKEPFHPPVKEPVPVKKEP